MCEPSWQSQLIQKLRHLQSPEHPARIAILGVGHELRGDDAVGVWLARELRVALSESAHMLIIEAGPMPENHFGALRRFGPDLVLLIDAAQMGETPGTIRWIDWELITGFSASTHSLPLHILARYMQNEFTCEVAVLGIQPANNTLLAPLSDPVVAAASEMVEAIVGVFENSYIE